MDTEREAITKIRNSFSQGMSRAEITRRLQKKGYKLEYIDELIKKSKKKILLKIIISLTILIILAFIIYFLLFSPQKHEISNPINENSEEINPEFISFLLNEIGAWKLRKNPTTLKNPILNFRISDKNFNSIITKGKIETFVGLNKNADIEFQISEEEIIAALKSDNQTEFMKKSVKESKTKIKKLASDPDLYIKGYLNLYNSLKTP